MDLRVDDARDTARVEFEASAPDVVGDDAVLKRELAAVVQDARSEAREPRAADRAHAIVVLDYAGSVDDECRIAAENDPYGRFVTHERQVADRRGLRTGAREQVEIEQEAVAHSLRHVVGRVDL